MDVIDPNRFRAESAVEVLERGFYFVEAGRFEYVGDEREWITDYYPVFVVVEDIPTASVRVVPSEELTVLPKLRGTAGAKPKFDRDAVQAYCYHWFDDIGVPDNVSKFCRENVIPWCSDRYDEDLIPDEETLRQYVPKWIEAWLRSQLPPT
jgi:hypothetical protein